MIVRIQSALLLGALSLLLLPAASNAQEAPSPDLLAQKQTVSDVRNVGTAMWHWYKEEVEAKRSPEAHKQAQQESGAKEVDLQRVPVISRQDLAAILVPRYLAAIPAADGWGHPYEFRLNTKDPNAIVVMALRSAGRDGKFSGTRYEVKSFEPTDFDQDIPWMDGYFVRWPQKAESGR
jgi:hypothetical protein